MTTAAAAAAAAAFDYGKRNLWTSLEWDISVSGLLPFRQPL